MKRSTGVTWDQLKVGAVVIVAIAIIGVAILKLGQSANLFSKRYELVSFVPNTAGLREGGQVTVAGQLAGSVKAIEFLPVDGDTMRNLKITVEVDRKVQAQIRQNSEAKLKTLGLLGDKVLDISPGTPQFPMLQPGDTIRLGVVADYEAVLAQAAGALDQVTVLTSSLQEVADGVTSGRGTLGQLITNRQMYDNLNATLASSNAVMVQLQNPRGTIGRLLNDPSIYNSLDRMLISADTLVAYLGAGVSSPDGTVGKLLRDDELYNKLVSAVSGVDSLVGTMQRGEGTMAKLFTEDEMYTQLLQAVTSMNAILVDVRRDPRRYTKGFISIF